MNALWITRMSEYKHSPLALVSAKHLIEMKVDAESALLRRYRRPSADIRSELAAAMDIGGVLLIEARAARHFWREFRALIPEDSGFETREPHANDPVNQMLDIGYHHLTNLVRRVLDERGVPADLGLLHVARATDSAPLAYDLVELFRADVVDAEALRFVRLKKRRPFSFEQEAIAGFLGRLNARLERRHYFRIFKSCRTYRYYIELQALKFIRAVDRGEPFEPVHLPTRHELRCRCCISSDTSETPQ